MTFKVIFILGIFAILVLNSGCEEGIIYKKFEECPSPDEWVNTNTSPFIGRMNPVAFEVGKVLYFGLGNTTDGKTFYNDFWKYNPENGTSPIQVSDFMGGPRSQAAGFVIGKTIYVGTGYTEDNNSNRTVFNDFYAYNLDTDSWSIIDPMPANDPGRKAAVGFSLNEKGYILTGCGKTCQGSSEGLKKDVYQYTPGIGWKKMNDFNGDPRGAAIGFIVDNKFYFGLGFMKNDLGVPHYDNDFWVYNQELDNWELVAGSFPGQGRDFPVSFSINELAYVGLGEDVINCTILNDFWQFNPKTNTWVSKPSFPFKMSWAAGVSSNGSGYVIPGARSGGNCLNIERFDQISKYLVY